jgi:hypothetical protein
MASDLHYGAPVAQSYMAISSLADERRFAIPLSLAGAGD